MKSYAERLPTYVILISYSKTPLSQIEQPMNRTKIGSILTFIWIIVGVGFIVFKFDSVRALKLNEIGDFLAGFFSPIAFMWLVIGYFQQGEELKLNTRALELQAAELKMSVEQQRELVEVTRADMKLTKQAYELEIEREVRKSQPSFHLQVGNYNHGTNGPAIINATLANHGHGATSLQFRCSAGDVIPNELPILSAESNRQIKVDVSKEPTWDFDVEVDYLDGLGVSRRQKFQALKNEQGHLIFLPPKEVYLTDV